MKNHLQTYRRSDMSLLSGHNLPVALVKVSDEATLGIEHQHTFYELVIITSGTGICECCEKRHVLNAGDVFLIPPGEKHTYIEQHNLHLLNVLWDDKELPIQKLDTRLFNEFVNCFYHRGTYPNREFVSFAKPHLEKIIALVESLAEELNSFKSGCLLACAGHLCILIAFLCQCYAESVKKQQINILKLEPVLNYLELHYAEKIRREKLAAMLHISLPTFYRHFLAETGLTFNEHLQRLRLSHAENLLRNTSLPITDIARRSGFANSSHFITQFHLRYGHSPHQYRKKLVAADSQCQES